jgi:hypothetical protein
VLGALPRVDPLAGARGRGLTRMAAGGRG